MVVSLAKLDWSGSFIVVHLPNANYTDYDKFLIRDDEVRTI